MLKVAFLGMGSIGRPMAKRISGAGFPLVVWNRTGARAAAFAHDINARAAATPAEAARDADVVVTCLSTSQDVLEVLEASLFEGLATGATFLDCTSGDPATSRRIADRLASKKVGFVDAPVSG